MGKEYTVAILGCGSRGCHTYGRLMLDMPGQYKIVALCDIDPAQVDRFAAAAGVPKKGLFYDAGEFLKKKRADVLVIATQDRDHVWMCVRAFELGYDVLLEKPISPVRAELYQLLDAHKKYGGKVAVCHVLRYAPGYVKVKELLESGVIGRLVRIESIEQVGYWHQAHSFVRGNWRNDATTSPMIMQKCCHDLDLLQYYANARCDTVYSDGALTYFKKENQPQGAADRCALCKFIDSCPYSAERLYIERWKSMGSPEDRWPFNVVQPDVPLTEEKLRRAYTEGPYGRCVFACDNNVVDVQSVSMSFENGVSATLTMTAFTAETGRIMTFHGTLGEITFRDAADLSLSVFGQPKKVWTLQDIFRERACDSFGHGGGDLALVHDFYDMLEGTAETGTTLEASVESHLMALAAEDSRKTGRVVRVHEI